MSLLRSPLPLTLALSPSGGEGIESAPSPSSIKRVGVRVSVWSRGIRADMVPASYYVGLSAVLFVIGVLGVLVRRDPLVIFMSIEIMLNAANLALVAFGQRHGSVDGQALVFFVLCVAAAEVAVGLAIIVAIFRLRRRLSVDELSLMRG